MILKTKLYFSVPVHTDVNSAFPMTENDNYWFLLINYFIKKSDTIEIQCWNEEESTIRELEVKMGHCFDISMEENMTIFKGELTDEITNLLLNDYVGKEGGIKWFSFFLNHGKVKIFSSEHWGTEFFAPELEESDITYIESIMPKETLWKK